MEPQSKLQALGRLYSYSEVADILRVKIGTIYNQVFQGKINIIQVGTSKNSRKLISERELERILNIQDPVSAPTKVYSPETFINPPIPEPHEMG
jgi:hypothetical protein